MVGEMHFWGYRNEQRVDAVLGLSPLLVGRLGGDGDDGGGGLVVHIAAKQRETVVLAAGQGFECAFVFGRDVVLGMA